MFKNISVSILIICFMASFAMAQASGSSIGFIDVQKINEEMIGKLQKDIIASTKKVAQEVGIDVVIDKQVIIVGGTDLTDLVITDIKK